MRRSKRSYKKSFKRRKSFRRRRSNFSKMKFKPEVKYTVLPWAINLNVPNHFPTTASESIPAANNTINIMTWPSQGTSDITRVGDTIHPVKAWIRLVFNKTNTAPQCTFRIIIYRHNKVLTSGIQANFWQTAVTNPNMGVVDREIVYKVLYDRVHVLNGTLTDEELVKKPIDINIRFRKPVIFHNGSIIPKDPRDELHAVFVPMIPLNNSAAATPITMSATTRFYYFDN